MSRGLKVIVSPLINGISVLGECARSLSYIPLRGANLLRVGAAPARHGSRTPILVKAITATARFSRWAIRPVGCFLLAFSTAYATGWVSKSPPNRPASSLCRVLLYRLNHASTPCIATAIGLYPGFTLPGKTLDASKHLEPIAKLTAYGG